MKNRVLREKDLLKLIEGLDIPQSLYVKAIEHYKAIASFLQGKDIESDIYPQGSYSLGTVVRPYTGDEEASYDLDAICEIKVNKGNTSAKEIKQMIGEALKSDGTYEKMLQQEWDKCWTLKYADANEIGFSVDIVPAVEDSDVQDQSIEEIRIGSNEVGRTQIAITNKQGNTYSWQKSNPKAYHEWFKKLNEPFLMVTRQRRKLNQSREFYNCSESTVEEIPVEQERSALQRVIQMFKYHADVYYSKGNIKEYKSASIVITTLIALIAQDASPELDIFSLLSFVIDELEVYGEHLILNESDFMQRYNNKHVIKQVNGQWILENPLNPSENIVDAWNKQPLKATYFFKWITQLKEDFIVSLDRDEKYFAAVLENNFEKNYLSHNIDFQSYVRKQPVNVQITTKPYRCYNENE